MAYPNNGNAMTLRAGSPDGKWNIAAREAGEIKSLVIIWRLPDAKLSKNNRTGLFS
jgi:hypothetical protein